MDAVRVETRTDLAVRIYGVTGKGVTIAILDRGIDWTHPDFIKPDGTTRIKWILDMTGQKNWCTASNPEPVEYTEAQINAALRGGPKINTRDAVGHGTNTAGVAAGNGRAFANGKYAGFAPEADLIIVKMTSDGVPAHDGEAAEASFVACVDQAFDRLDLKITQLGQPVVGLMNSGTQFGPMGGAAPILQGSIALMLQLNPELTARQARHIIQQTARWDSSTGPPPNSSWRYGKLDVLAALDAVWGMSR